MKYLLTILAIILGLIFISNAEKEAELKEIQIIKEAENSNDPVLKQKAANMKAEIARKEQAKLQRQIENQQSEEQAKLQRQIENQQNEELYKEFETIILLGLNVIFIAFAYLGFRLLLDKINSSR